ncbi:hypothetical protein [Legionella longbeachae]|uniref:hypothetical protein n=1 Tax=Legionella longbeachae TaxID=450 RepID=UPI001244115F|nr:hypothetical protein [Legionella longbeachae]QEY52652.1 hypothetical protein FQU71_16235 [Legionella longbeachae]
MLEKLFKRLQGIKPFTNQFDMLMESGQAINDDGEAVGMCQPMSNHYLDLLLNKQDPTQELQDGKQFLKKSIIEENQEIDFRAQNPGEDEHHAFHKNKVEHRDEQHSLKSLTPEKVSKTLEDKDHMLMTFELSQKDKYHQVYFGKQSASKCRFFDANLNGGERVKPCDELIPEMMEYLKKRYSLDEDTSFKLGIG